MSQHLAHADSSRPTLGAVSLVDGMLHLHDAAPHVLQMARRVFPGADARRGNTMRFSLTRRSVEDLRWFMLRYPMGVDADASAAIDAVEAQTRELVRRREAGEVERAIDPGASFVGTPLEYQRTGCGFLVENRRCLLGDDMGLGKTVEAIMGLSVVDRWPWVVVVPPGNVGGQWAESLEAFLRPQRGNLSGWSHVISGTRPYPLPVVPVYVVHYDLVRFWVDRLAALRDGAGPVGVVFDEAQWLRRTQSKRYAACSAMTDRMEYVWGLSGTPIYNYGAEIWAVMNCLEHGCLGDESSFGREWCSVAGGKTVAKPDVLGDYLRREGLLLRRVKADVLSQLPPKRRATHVVDHDSSVYDREIRRAVELAGRYRDGEMERRERFNMAGMIEAETRRATGVAKAPYVAAFVDSLVESGERPLVYAHHHAVHEALRAGLDGRGVVGITGRETVKEKRAAVDAFAAGDASVCVIGLRTAAGIDGLQGRATCVVFAELDWSPAIHAQCEDRVQRIGMDESMDSLMCWYLVSETGYDAVIRDALGLKIGQFTALMGDKAEDEDERAVNRQAVEGHARLLVERLVGRGTGSEVAA